MKDGITYIERSKFEALIAASGLARTDKSGWIRVDGNEGRRLYVPLTKRVGQVDLVGLGDEAGVRDHNNPHGSVTHELDMTGAEDDILTAFTGLLGALKTLEAVVKPAKEVKAKEPKAAKAPTEAKQSKAARRALIERIAAEKGVTVSPNAPVAMADEEPEPSVEDILEEAGISVDE